LADNLASLTDLERVRNGSDAVNAEH